MKQHCIISVSGAYNLVAIQIVECMSRRKTPKGERRVITHFHTHRISQEKRTSDLRKNINFNWPM
jgi:hypothetical protein